MTNTEIDNEGRYVPSAAIMLDLRQFDRLREVNPPLDAAEIAHRMVWPIADVIWLLRKFRDPRWRINPHEYRIMMLRQQNKTFGEIAKELKISRGTVAGVVARHKERVDLNTRG